MEPRRFDRFADEYTTLHARNVAISGETPDYFAEYKIERLRKALDSERISTEKLRILDFGAGVGNSIAHFRKYFPGCQLICTDVSERSLKIARRRFGASAEYVLFGGETLPFRDASFDLAFTACVFHHIASSEHVAILREIRRILTAGSRLFLYEHNPFNPLTVQAVRTCEFDEDAILIRSAVMRERFDQAGYSHTSVRYHVFFPKFLRHLRFLEPSLRSIPIGAQYCIEGIADSPLDKAARS